jgi:hypothetical protein
MKDLTEAVRLHPGCDSKDTKTVPNIKSAQLGQKLWYTSSALNTSVVLCGPSGAVLDLRFPASSFLRKFYA